MVEWMVPTSLVRPHSVQSQPGHVPRRAMDPVHSIKTLNRLCLLSSSKLAFGLGSQAVWIFLALVLVTSNSRASVAQELATKPLMALRPTSVGTQPYALARLERIESQQLPPTLVDGPAQYSSLPAYYEAANQDLAERLAVCKSCFESDPSSTIHRMTLISGVAGAGKTFLKGMVFRNDYPQGTVHKFDLRELYDLWQEQGLVEPRPDLASQGLTLNQLPAVKGPRDSQILDYLNRQPGNFFVIDSLDEIHPDDSQWVLEQIEQFTFESFRPFLHVVVLGRGSSFRDYWVKHHKDRPREDLALFNLGAPQFKTTGDLQVSTWNYHCFRNRLSWNQSDRGPFTLEDFAAWESSDFQRTGSFKDISITSETAVDASIEKTFSQWAQARPYLNDMLRNLAGNSMIREIAYERLNENRDCGESAIKRAYIRACLERNARSHGRPTLENAELGPVYLQLLISIAQRMAQPDRLDDQGYFVPRAGETIKVVHGGKEYTFPIQNVLERSGLIYVNALKTENPSYRFEPLWVHRALLDAVAADAQPTLQASR
jgi:hypothetical protein